MNDAAATGKTLTVPEAGPVDSLVRRPPDARAMFVFAHGAGAPMRHAFMNALSGALAERAIATLRFNFPYSQAGRRGPDRPALLEATIRAAIALAREQAPTLPLFAGGKSMGGRMTSQALAQEPDDNVRGIVFVGFPLHGAGKPPDARRADHLARVRQPMLFIQGTRDTLARLDLIQDVTTRLGQRATLHIIEDADHGFHVRRSSGRSDAAVVDEIAEAMARWMTANG